MTAWLTELLLVCLGRQTVCLPYVYPGVDQTCGSWQILAANSFSLPMICSVGPDSILLTQRFSPYWFN